MATCLMIRGPLSGREWHVSSTGVVDRPLSVRALNVVPEPHLYNAPAQERRPIRREG